jgi:hypothetical protein
MSSAVISTSAAQGRFFVFDAEIDSGFPCHPERRVEGYLGSANPRLAGIVPASRLAARPAPEMVSSGIAAVDAISGGLPRGCLTEIFGPASSGRTTMLLAALAAATRRGEVCAVVDAGDALDPQSVAAAGAELNRLLWVRCADHSPQRHRDTEKNSKNIRISKFDENAEHRLEQLMRATDLLLESGGFGLIVLDLCDLPPQATRRIPLTTWFRFRRAVEHTSTVLLAIEQQPIAGSCSSLLIKLGAARNRIKEESMNFQCSKPTHAQLLTGLEINVEVVRSRMGTDRKPAGSVSTTFASQTAWAG